MNSEVDAAFSFTSSDAHFQVQKSISSPIPHNNSSDYTSNPIELLGPRLASYLLPITTFNKVQATVAPALLGLTSNPPYQSCPIHNILVEAPTGSGKTVLLELAIIALFRDRLLASTDGSTPPANSGPTQKAVYISPIKALATEKFDSMSAKFGKVLKVVMETGDGISTSDNSFQGEMGVSDGVYRDPYHSLETILSADIVITTPERWDSITRRWRDGAMALSLMASIGLLLIDEVHVVGEVSQMTASVFPGKTHMDFTDTCIPIPSSDLAAGNSSRRGAVLEALVSRTKAVQMALGSSVPVRLIAVSGTIPNIADLAEWLLVPKSGCFRFHDEDRPVPLSIKVIGYPKNGNPFLFERGLNYKLLSLIQQHCTDGPSAPVKPTLVFCSSRKETVFSACHLADEILKIAQQGYHAHSHLHPSSSTTGGVAAANVLQSLACTIRLPDGTSMADASASAIDKQLQQCLLAGVAFHHAALCPADRKLVESLFRGQFVSVCCTTSTLAMGVNLPARLVIIKGTTFYRSDGPVTGGSGASTRRVDIPTTELLQMAGRAGRLGLDHKGVALILTSQDKVPLYKILDNTNASSSQVSLVQPPLESQLHQALIDNINAEVALRTIQTVPMGLAWAKTTFLWIRLKQNPLYYFSHLQSHIQMIESQYPSSKNLFTELRQHCHNFVEGSERLGHLLEAFISHLVLALMKKLHNEHMVQLQPLSIAHPLPLPRLPEDGADYDDVGVDSIDDRLASSPFIASESVGTSIALPLLSCEPTRLGKLAAKYYICFSTVETFNKALLFRMISRSTFEYRDNPETNSATEKQSSAGLELFPSKYRIPHRYLLQVLCNATELVNDLRLRLGDKGALNRMHKRQRFPLLASLMNTGHPADHLPLPPSAHPTDTDIIPHASNDKPPPSPAIADGIKETWHKIFVLTQIRLSDPSSSTLGDEFSLRNDVSRLWNSIPRLAKFLTVYCHFCCNLVAEAESKLHWSEAGPSDGASSHGYLIEMAWSLQRSIERGIWDFGAEMEKQCAVASCSMGYATAAHGGLYLKQLDGIGEAAARQLAALSINYSCSEGTMPSCKGLCTFSHVIKYISSLENHHNPVGSAVDVSAGGRRIELLVHKSPPFGTGLIQQCLSLPIFEAPVDEKDPTEVIDDHPKPVSLFAQILHLENPRFSNSKTQSSPSARLAPTAAPMVRWDALASADCLNKFCKILADRHPSTRIIALAGVYVLRLQQRQYQIIKTSSSFTSSTPVAAPQRTLLFGKPTFDHSNNDPFLEAFHSKNVLQSYPHFGSLVARNCWRVVVCLRRYPYTLLLDRKLMKKEKTGSDDEEKMNNFSIPFQILFNLSNKSENDVPFRNVLPVTIYLFHEALLGADQRIDVDLPCASYGLSNDGLNAEAPTDPKPETTKLQKKRNIGEKQPRNATKTPQDNPPKKRYILPTDEMEEGNLGDSAPPTTLGHRTEEADEILVPTHFTQFMQQKMKLWEKVTHTSGTGGLSDHSADQKMAPEKIELSNKYLPPPPLGPPKQHENLTQNTKQRDDFSSKLKETLRPPRRIIIPDEDIDVQVDLLLPKASSLTSNNEMSVTEMSSDRLPCSEKKNPAPVTLPPSPSPRPGNGAVAAAQSNNEAIRGMLGFKRQDMGFRPDVTQPPSRACFQKAPESINSEHLYKQSLVDIGAPSLVTADDIINSSNSTRHTKPTAQPAQVCDPRGSFGHRLEATGMCNPIPPNDLSPQTLEYKCASRRCIATTPSKPNDIDSARAAIARASSNTYSHFNCGIGETIAPVMRPEKNFNILPATYPLRARPIPPSGESYFETSTQKNGLQFALTGSPVYYQELPYHSATAHSTHEVYHRPQQYSNSQMQHARQSYNDAIQPLIHHSPRLPNYFTHPTRHTNHSPRARNWWE